VRQGGRRGERHTEMKFSTATEGIVRVPPAASHSVAHHHTRHLPTLSVASRFAPASSKCKKGTWYYALRPQWQGVSGTFLFKVAPSPWREAMTRRRMGAVGEGGVRLGLAAARGVSTELAFYRQGL